NELSSAATLLVMSTAGPSITAHPRSATVFAGGRMAFAVAATGTGTLTYQWKKAGAELPGETGARLDLASVQPTDTGAYSVVVTDSSGSVTSAVATLTVTSHTFTLPPSAAVVGLGGPSVPAGLDDVVGIAAGQRHGLALRSNGTVAEWNDFTPLPGDPSTRVPADLSNVVAVAAGFFHSIALRRDGTVVGWGGPPVPTDLLGVIAIAAGPHHGIALKADGTVATWGFAASQPAGLRKVVAVAAAGL